MKKTAVVGRSFRHSVFVDKMDLKEDYEGFGQLGQGMSFPLWPLTRHESRADNPPQSRWILTAPKQHFLDRCMPAQRI
jgi:hypothetical protein